MRICPQCGHELEDAEASLCPHCGAPLAAEEPAPEQVEQIPLLATVGAPQQQAPSGSADSSPVGPTYAPAHGAPLSNTPAFVQGVSRERKRRSPWPPVMLGVVVALLLTAFGIVYSRQPYVPPPPFPSEATHTAAAATATGVANTILNDSLSTNTHGWPADGVSCAFKQGGYLIHGAHVCLAPISAPTNGVESVTTLQMQGTAIEEYGLVLRWTSPGNYYLFGIDSQSQWMFEKFVNGRLTLLQSFTLGAIINEGGNALSVTMDGSTFVCSVNGIEVGTIQDTTFTHGQWGLASSAGADVLFTSYYAQK